MGQASTDLARLTALADGLRVKQQTSNKRSWFDIKNAGSETTLIHIHDVIGDWGITSADFTRELLNVTSPNIEVHLNSEGGAVFDGIAIYTALMEHPASITTVVDGLAASAASFIMQAGAVRKMGSKTRLMIHNAQGVCMGDEVDGEEFVRLLKDLTDNIADIYAERSGKGDRAHWRSLMGANRTSGTWFSAEQAVEAGLADEILGESTKNGADRVNSITALATDAAPATQATPATPTEPNAQDSTDDLFEIFRVFSGGAQ